MGAHRAADRHRHHRSDSSVSELRSAATAAGRHGFRYRIDLPAAPQFVPFYQKMFSLYGNTAGTPLAVLGCPFDPAEPPLALRPMETAAPTARASRIPATITSRCRPSASITTSTRTTPPGFAFKPTPACRPPTPIRSIPLFNAISPQPLYSFAAGYTHVFSQNLVNYFNPAFSWYESLFGPADFQKTLAAFPIVLQGSGANAPFTTLGGLDNTWVQGRRATRVLHQRQSGLEPRRARTPLRNQHPHLPPERLRLRRRHRPHRHLHHSAAIHLRTWRPPPPKPFPSSANEPFNFLNLDLYAQDTWKVTRTLTWTFGLRDTFNSNPLNPHDAGRPSRRLLRFDLARRQPAAQRRHPDRSRQSLFFDAARHPAAPNRARLAIRAQIRAARRLRHLQRHPARQRRRPRRHQSALRQNFSGRPARNRRRHGHRARSAQQRGRRHRRRQSNLHFRISPRASSPAHLRRPNPATCLPPVAITAVPDGKLHAPYFMEWSFGIEHQFGTDRQLARAIRRHARREPALSDAGERLSDGLRRLLRAVPVPAARPTRASAPSRNFPPARTATTTACSSPPRNAWHTACRARSTTPSAAAWTRFPTAASCNSPPEASSRRCPATLARDYGPCDYDIRHNLTAQYVYQLPVKATQPRSRLRAQRLAGLRHRLLAQRNSILRPEHALLSQRQRHRAGQRTAIRQRRSRRAAATTHHPIPGVTQPGTLQWLNPDAFVSAVDPSTGACAGGDNPQTCQFGNLGRNALRGPDFFWSDFYLTKCFPLTEHVKLRFDGQFFNVFNHPNFGLPSTGPGRHPRKALHPNRLRRSHLHHRPAHRTARRRPRRRQLAPHDRLPGARGVLNKFSFGTGFQR